MEKSNRPGPNLENNVDPRHDEESAHEAIKHAFLKPTLLDREQSLDFIRRRIWLGLPEPAKLTAKGKPFKLGKMGPKSRRTQYDDALISRIDLYRRLASAPNAKRLISIEAICKVFDEQVARGTPRSKLIRATEGTLIKAGLIPPTLINIRKALKRAGRWPTTLE